MQQGGGCSEERVTKKFELRQEHVSKCMGVTPTLHPWSQRQRIYSSSKQGDFALRRQWTPWPKSDCSSLLQVVSGRPRSFVFAKQAAAAGVAESNSGVCNMYDKRERYQHQRVRGGRARITSYALSPIWPHSNAADDRSRQRGAARAVDEQIGGACVCHAHAYVPCVHLALWRAQQRACTTHVSQGSTAKEGPEGFSVIHPSP